ncbi:hypothetical protein M1N24_02580 [Dehalococcoidia bacterium]|nr:hypothetical protein [Dehalococcoidia bacterium]
MRLKSNTLLLLLATPMLLLGACRGASEPALVTPTATLDIEATASVIDQPVTPSKFEVLNKHPKYDCLNTEMGMFIEVFGVYVIAPNTAPRNYVIHTANILAQYIDNDEDGIPDDADVLKHLIENNYVVPVWTTSDRSHFWEKARGTYCEDNIGMAASMYYDEDQWALGGIKRDGIWDTNLEEVWHVVTRAWSATYPEVFSVAKPSLLTDAMDVARGGYFEEVPSKYPPEAWYKYYDESCEYECQASEYIYWALMANIGALDPNLTDKCESSADEWYICTATELRGKDILINQILNDKGFKLPTRIPDGSYQ